MADLPFLNKKKPQGSVVMNSEPSDVDAIVDMVTDEFLDALEKKDKNLLRAAFKALVFHCLESEKDEE